MLKIDKSFVDGIGRAARTPPWPQAIVELSHTLSCTRSPRASSTPSRRPPAALGCQLGQGYLFARPLPVGAMTELLAGCMADGGFYLPAATAVEAAAAT